MTNRHALHSLLLVFFLIPACWAADNPFVGDWKLNTSKSTLTDRMKVKNAGGNTYTFEFEGGGPETIVVDGTDQPTPVYKDGTLAVAVDGDTWKVTRKKNGHTILTAIWRLSNGGNTLTDHFSAFNADGSPYDLNTVYERKAGGPGFAGTWVSTSEKAVNFIIEFQIQPYETEGLSFIDPSSQFTGNMNFAASSVHRLDEHTLELMRKKDEGALVEFLHLELSPDLKTLTVTTHPAAGDKPNILIFDRH